MERISFYANAAALGIVVLSWLVFALTFLFWKKPISSTPDTKRAPKSFAGLALQGIAFGLVWMMRRVPVFSPFVDNQFVVNIVLQGAAVFLVVGSVWLARAAIRELGKQWSLQARLIEDHNLITGGVYQIVRHPIYTAMFGMLIATALVFSHWLVTIFAVIVFLIGTKIRTASEEKLLRETFPQEYETYARKVPAFIPFIKI